MTKANFIMMCGIPRSGKSTIAKDIQEESMLEYFYHLSSDGIREELYGDESEQGDPKVVFDEMKNRTVKLLSEGRNVVYDATNINRKKRKALLSHIPKDVDKTVIYVSTKFRDCIDRNSSRERVVPYHVMLNMYKNMQIPIYSEGWDAIVYTNDFIEYGDAFIQSVRDEVKNNRSGKIMETLASSFTEFFDIYDTPQDSKYHSFSIHRHIKYVYDYINEIEFEDEREREIMIWSALLHDIGKKICKSFKNRKGEETRHANFIGHENVGSQVAIPFLYELGYDMEFVYDVSVLIQFHMKLLKDMSEKGHNRLKRDVGEDVYKKLEILRDADNQAH